MLDQLWGQLKNRWKALPEWLSITIANTVHQIAHIILMFVDGIKSSFVGHGILISLGWTISSTNYLPTTVNNNISITPSVYTHNSIVYLGFLDILSDILGTLMIALPYCSALIIWYSFISPQNTLKCRDKWLTHAALSILPLAVICGGTSAIGAITLNSSAVEVAHSAAASTIGTWVFSIPTTVLIIIFFKQFCSIYQRHSTLHHATNPSSTIKPDLSILIRNNIIHEVINAIILYILGTASSLIGLSVLYAIKPFESVIFLNTFIGDLTGISIVIIPLSIFYCCINISFQKKDVLTERSARTRHCALRLGPTSIGMPIMTLVGSFICFGNHNLSIVAAGNAIGILIISGTICGITTLTNKILKLVTRRQELALSEFQTEQIVTYTPTLIYQPIIIYRPINNSSYEYYIPPLLNPLQPTHTITARI